MAGTAYKEVGEGDYQEAGMSLAPLLAGMVVPGAPKGVRGPKAIPREIDARGFYSPSLEAVKGLGQETGTVQQFRSMLLKAGGKPKELEAVGFDRAFPDPNAKVSRQDIEQYLRDNRVQLGEKVYADPTFEDHLANVKDAASKPSDYTAYAKGLLADYERTGNTADIMKFDVGGHLPDPPKFGGYATPGGDRYREVVTTLPFDQSVPLKLEKLEPFGPDGSGDAMWQGRNLVRGVTEAPFEIGNQRIGRVTHWPETFDHMGRPQGERYVVNSPNMQNAQFKSLEDAKAAISKNYNEANPNNYMNKSREDVYTSSHWPGITNPLLHYRTKKFDSGSRAEQVDPSGGLPSNSAETGSSPSPQSGSRDRTTSGGAQRQPESTLLLDEMQSDWAQRARDQGTRDPAVAAELRLQHDAAEKQWTEAMDDGSLFMSRLPEGVLDDKFRYRNLSTKADIRNPAVFRSVSPKAFMDMMDDIPSGRLSEGDLKTIEAVKGRMLTGLDRSNDLFNKLQAAERGVPSAPYISNTSDWVDLGLKQALIDAAKDPQIGRLAWPPGSEHVRRYPSLGDVVDAVDYRKNPDGTYALSYQKNGRGTSMGDNVPEADLAGHVGRDVADQIVAGQGESMNWSGNNEPPKIWNTIKGNALNVRTKEGVGMGKFYGEMTPEGYQSGIVGTRLQKLVKGLDPEAARVEPTKIPNDIKGTFYEHGRPVRVQNRDGWGIEYQDGTFRGGWISKADAERSMQGQIEDFTANQGVPGPNYPSIPITPAMRAKILKEGLPLFNVAALSALLSRILGQGQDTGEDQ
jgi:hypothetical protein